MRIVIDTNIWVSGLLWRGLPGRILLLAEAGQIELCTCPDLVDELQQVLSHEKFQSRLGELGLSVNDLLLYVLDLALVFESEIRSPIVKADPDDDIFIYCALAAGADYIVSGDQHLLDIGEYKGISIITARELLLREFPQEVS
jgi:putative PIN family toxin of toxin-antitoxin system